MDRSTTKEEYKAFMRKWRAVLEECSPSRDFWKKDKSVRDGARSIAFGAVYDLVPSEFWSFRKQIRCGQYGVGTPYFAKLNIECLPNSHPHKTRNP